MLDPHTHSSFSDGHVWPRIRVEEALRDGLDALAITEHLEWQPHLADIPHPDRNRSYEVAVGASEESELIVIAGVEVTRKVPHGHINALFISDVNKMFANFAPEDPKNIHGYYYTTGEWPAQNAVDAANAQGGHRPVTLVLAAERSGETIREALFEGRTVVWFKNTLFGYEPNMDELLQASLAVSSSYYAGNLMC